MWESSCELPERQVAVGAGVLYGPAVHGDRKHRLLPTPPMSRTSWWRFSALGKTIARWTFHLQFQLNANKSFLINLQDNNLTNYQPWSFTQFPPSNDNCWLNQSLTFSY